MINIEMAGNQVMLPMSARSDLSSRPLLHTRQSLPRITRPKGLDRNITSSRPGFSSSEVDAVIREKIRKNYQAFKQACISLDSENKQHITKDDFRSVMNSYCLPLTTNQFETLLSKIERHEDGSIFYLKFLEKYGQGSERQNTGIVSSEGRFIFRNSSQMSPNKDITVESLENMLKEKIQDNFKSIVKAIHMFDYNMDGKIQKYEFRKILENYCCKLTDLQFDKLWQRYDINHTGRIFYKEFLKRLGFQLDKLISVVDTTSGSVNIPLTFQQSDKLNDNKVKHQLRQDEQWMKTLSFEQIEQEFRKRIKKNMVNIKKSLMVFDKNLSGFVNIEDMKSILNNFTLPMSNQLFVKLMDRCGIKASGRIAWELFLMKFEDALEVGNGQTLPIKPAHKFFPIMEAQSTVKSDDIWNQLYKSIESHYSSFKQAFLDFDIKRTGQITRKDFRRILERYTFELDDKQFNCVMLKLDPHHTNNITYQKFLQLFEEKDTWEGHKWLNSMHRFNEKQKPIIMAWESIEDILREKIAENWSNVSNAIVCYDYLEEGLIHPKALKKVLDKYVLPISDDHFQHLLRNCYGLNNKVDYVDFLEKLNVSVSPGDLDGLSSQIYMNNKLTEQTRFINHINRQHQINQRLEDRTNFISAEEVLVRLQDRISQYKTQLFKAFQNLDITGRGKISKKNFRTLLYNMGFIMSEDQYQLLLSKLQFHNGLMSFNDFISNFENRNSQDIDIHRSGNHHVNIIRGDEYGFNAQEVEERLRTKLRDNFPDLRSAFYKFDDDHNGLLTKQNFRRMLDSFLILTNDEEYEILCQRLGITKHSRISYPDFLNKFEVRDTKDGHKWLNSVHRFNTTIPPRNLSAEETHEELKTKAHRQFAYLSKAFLAFDTKKNGVIKKNELKNILHRFMITLLPEQFDKLWKMYDTDSKGYVSHQDFLQKLGASEFTPSDKGTSLAITDGSQKALIEHNMSQQKRHENATLNQAELGVRMTAEYVEEQLRKIMQEKYKDFYQAFRTYDIKRRGYLSVNEVQKVLVDLNFFLSDEEFFRLLDRIGLVTNNSRLNYEDFLKAFQGGRASSFGHREAEVNYLPEEKSHLSPQSADDKMTAKIITQKYNIEKACLSFDKEQNGLICLTDLRRILDMFCFKLTNKQWTHFINKFPKESDNMIAYKTFLSHFSSTQDDSSGWLNMLKKSSLVTADKNINDDMEEKLKESVLAHFSTIAPALEEIDYANIGVVSKEDFHSLLDTEVFKLTEQQFEKLWSSLPVNEFGNLDYHEWLKGYDNEYIPKTSPRPTTHVSSMDVPIDIKPMDSISQRSVSRSESQMSCRTSTSRSRLTTPLVNAETAEQNVKDIVFKHWKSIQRKCRKLDIDSSGAIDAQQFKDVMADYNINLSSDDFQKLLIKYDLRENGKFCYADFLRHFILDIKSRESKTSSKRKPFQPTILEATIEVVNNQFVEAMRQVKATVANHWRDMRRMFKIIDNQSTGFVSTDEFRKVLRQFNVNLNEDEFSQIILFYEKSLDDQINYNEFIKAYLQNQI